MPFPKDSSRPRIGWSFDLDRRGVALTAYLVVGFLISFWQLGANGIIHMEGMVADGGRHMLVSGDWLVPRVYGEIYTYKPAMAYWLAAFAHAIADPPPEWLLRLPFTASVFAMGLVVFALTEKLSGARVAAVASIAALSGRIVLEKVRLAEFDGILTAGTGIAIVAACYNLTSAAPRARVWVLGYLGLALGFLAKGMPALMIFGPGLLAAAWATGQFRRLFEGRHLAGALLFVALCGSYLVAAYHSEGPAVFAQPVAESKLRGLSWQGAAGEPDSLATDTPRLDAEARAAAGSAAAVLAATATKPLLVIAAFLPWSLLLPFALGKKTRRGLDEPSGRLLRAAGAFLVAGVLIFMAVPIHETRYYMPLCVPMGLVAGLVATGRTAAGPGGRRAMTIAAGAVAGLGVLLAFAGAVLLESPPATPAVRALLALVGASGLAVAYRAIRDNGRDTIVILVTISTLASIALETLARQPRRESTRNLEAQARALGPHLPAGEPVWVLGPSDTAGKVSSLFFYLDRPILAFRPGWRLPPEGSFCVLTSDRVSEVEGAPGFLFDEIVRVEHPRRDFLLGRCAWRQGSLR